MTGESIVLEKSNEVNLSSGGFETFWAISLDGGGNTREVDTGVGRIDRTAYHDNKCSSHFSTKDETLPFSKSANASKALRASASG